MTNDTDLDRILEAMANHHRRAIIYTLGLQPRSISQLAQQQKLSLPAIHKHIKVLEAAGLIQRKKSGRTNFLALDKVALGDLQRWLMQFYSGWGNREETLENYVASIERAEDISTNKTKE